VTFWSSQRLESHLASLVGHTDKTLVDCNAITLRIGDEVYVTPTLDNPSPSTHTKQVLPADGPFTIPPGQFAFLLTEELVTIPAERMGFISIKTTFKAKGLVNVSGFHVDPGWKGRLIFSVFNAGPATIHLQRGLPMFLLWIADLDARSEKHKSVAGPQGIPPLLIGNITGTVDSIYALEKRLKAEIKAVEGKQEAFRDQVSKFDRRLTRVLIFLSIAATLGSAIIGGFARDFISYVTEHRAGAAVQQPAAFSAATNSSTTPPGAKASNAPVPPRSGASPQNTNGTPQGPH